MMMMMEDCCCWALLVPNESYVDKALRAVVQLQQVGTRGRVLCLLGSATSKESRTKLDTLCDQVVVVYRKHDFEGLEEAPAGGSSVSDECLDQFLVNAVVGCSDVLLNFKKIAFIHPEIAILQRPDSVFHGGRAGVLADTSGSWALIILEPALTLKGGGNEETEMMLSSLEDLCKLVGVYGGGQGPHPQVIIPKLADLSTLVPLQKDLILVKLDETDEAMADYYSPLLTTTTTTSNGGTNGTLGHMKESRNWVAVIGMSCRFPQANSLEEYWTILEQGRNTASSSSSSAPSPLQERAGLCALDPSAARGGNWLGCRVDHFDADFFRVAPSEAGFMDPQCRLVLEASWEALEDAGVRPGEELRGSDTGVFYGSWLQDYKELMNGEGGSSPSTSDFVRKYMSNAFGASGAKLSFFYGLSGPNVATESGCSSSMVAVDLAVKSLLRGECGGGGGGGGLALAAGSNLILQWKEQQNRIWARDGRCKTFDAGVDGYGRAEGVAVLVLKRYADAVAAKDRIYGVICGSGVSQEGESASFGSPTVKSEASCMKAALSSAGLTPADVDYIEAHGTGTAVGDPVEAAAIVEAYGTCAGERGISPLYIASGKTNIGHTESCSGIAGIIKVLLSMKHELIPRHLNVAELNPKVKACFEQLGAVIPLHQSVPWRRSPDRARYAAVSSFGITGTDVHMILREAPCQIPPKCLLSPRPSRMTVPHILCLSARTQPALEQLTQRYLTFLEEKNAAGASSLMDVCYTTNACREVHPLRRVITGKSVEELGNKIRSRAWIDGGGGDPRSENKRFGGGGGGVCFTFPGVIGKLEMAGAAQLYSSFPVFKLNMDKCDGIFRAMTTTGLSLLPALLGPEEVNNPVGPMERLAAVIAVQYSLAQLWSSWGVKPAAVMGHCVGEVVAAVVAGVMGLEDGFKIIVSCFTRFSQLLGGHSGEMLAVEGDHGTVEQLMEQYYNSDAGRVTTGAESMSNHFQQPLEIAALNSKSQTVLSGPASHVRAFGAFCSERAGVKVHRVPTDFPMHSSAIQGPLTEVAREFFPETFSPPAIPYISSVTGGLIAHGDVSKDYWFRCFRDKVRFTDACSTASSLGVGLFLELGLGSSLTRLTAENLVVSSSSAESGGVLPECTPTFQRGGGDGGGIAGTIASLVALGVVVEDFDWGGYYQYHQVSKVSLPHYPFQRKSYWFKKRKRQQGRRPMMMPRRMMMMSRGESESSRLGYHPLLGGPVSLAASRQQKNDVVTFEACLSLSSSSSYPTLQFLADHVIGTEVVFPAAGYLEMMLAAGAAGTHGQGDKPDGSTTGCVSIRHFSISAPLLLDLDHSADDDDDDSTTPTIVQTVVELLEEEEGPRTAAVLGNSKKVSVYSERGLNDWKFHASGTLDRDDDDDGGPLMKPEAGGKLVRRLDLQEIMGRVALEDECPDQFYRETASAGLVFGECFRSLLTFHRNDEAEEALAEVQVPLETSHHDGHHLLHPILIDAMIQAYLMWRWEELGRRLHVPVSISKFQLLQQQPVRGEEEEGEWRQRRFYVYIKRGDGDGKTRSPSSDVRIVLADHHDGAVLALMENPVLVPTSVDAVLAAGGRGRGVETGSTSSSSSLPTYQVSWEPALHQLPNSILPCPAPTAAALSLSTIVDSYSGRQNNSSEEEARLLDANINRLCLLYVLNMLYEVGWWWSPTGEEVEVGTSWLLPDLISEFKVKEPLALAFSRYLDFLVEEGLLKREDGGGNGERQTLITLTSAPPPWESVKEEILRSLELLRDYPTLPVISACGSNLRAALQGELSGQYILFGKGGGGGHGQQEGDDGGEGGGDTLAETYYSTHRFGAEHMAALQHAFEEVCRQHQHQQQHRPDEPIRILEVGAGTGAFTRVALKSLAETGIPFQYHFTDISPAHFEGAQERFQGHSGAMVYRTLDIEKDPLAQGFPPAYFDVVVGVDVFHATRRLEETIRNAGLVTTRVGGGGGGGGGALIIGETERPVREIDIIFGILSGYWTFEDVGLRRSHCVAGSEVWEEVLSQVGFSESCHLLTGGGQKSVIVGRLTGTGGEVVPPREQHGQEMSSPRRRRGWLAIGEHFPEGFEHHLFVDKLGRLGRDCLVVATSSSSFKDDEDTLRQLIKGLMEEKGGLEGILVFAGQRRRAAAEESTPEWGDRRDLLKAMFTTWKAIGGGGHHRPRLHLVTFGTWASGHEGDGLAASAAVLDPSAGALWGLARSARMELSDLVSKCIDLDPAEASGEENMERLLMELWLDDKEPDVLHRQGLRYVRRLRAEKEKSPPNLLEFPLSSRFEICLPKSRDIRDLRFVPKKEAGGAELSGQQIEVEMKSASLNFRDVLIVMKPAGSVFESMSVVGIDYAGVVTRTGPSVQRLRVGQRVYGMSTSESTISSHIVTEESHGIEIPPGLTFAEAATLPAVFLTVWYCMVEVARVKPGQTVLVHAVTGGVGLAAIQLGKILGVEVIGTAGSPRKRNYARSLGITHVFHSRDLTFREQVKQVTGGTGVDMVLNCLTGPGFKEASLELVKDGGHFVEISKLDVWSKEEVQSLRPQVHYKLVWLPDVQPQLISSMMGKMNELVESGALTPLPMTRFLASQLPSALSSLQRAKQLGKVIVDLPSFHPEQNRFTEQLLFGGGDSRTCLITGGLGAIGLAVAKWMASQGARHIVLVGRSPPSQAALETINALKAEFGGTTVLCKQADISSYEQTKALLEDLTAVDGLPPLGGIHHCAGVLNDQLLASQEWEEGFQSVLKPKADGLYNLHRLTTTTVHTLQYFVAYSSMSSTMGNVGQGNYAAGNAYMDALMGARAEAGLPALVINWGQWKAGLAEDFEVRFASPFSVPVGIGALERALLEHKSAVVAGHFDFSQLSKMYPNYGSSLLKHVGSTTTSGEGKKEGVEEVVGGFGGAEGRKRGDPFLVQYNQKKKERDGMSEEERELLIASFVRGLVCSILGLGIDEIEDNTEFSSMGMDSLMSIDFTNKLQSELPGAALGYIDMAEFGTVIKMAGFIASLIR